MVGLRDWKGLYKIASGGWITQLFIFLEKIYFSIVLNLYNLISVLYRAIRFTLVRRLRKWVDSPGLFKLLVNAMADYNIRKKRKKIKKKIITISKRFMSL